MPMTNQSLAARRSSAAAKSTAQNPMRLLLTLYREDWGKLALASLIYIVKHSPVWIMPLITADIINIIASQGQIGLGRLWFDGFLLLIVLLQNIPTQYVYIRLLSRAIRRMESKLRSMLAQQLQLISIGFYT